MHSAFFPLSRRGFLVSGAAALAAARNLPAITSGHPANPSCSLVTEQEQGPFYIADELLRSDITEGKIGIPLKLRVAVVNANNCSPIANAALDIWHCDAGGIYSGFNAMGPGGPGGRGPGGRGPDTNGDRGGFDGFGGPPGGGFGQGGPPQPPIANQNRFLRGVQLTDAHGLAEFNTMYPGWYQGRAIHIHVKVHLGGETANTKYQGGYVAHTGQFFFPEEISADIAKMHPYAQHANVHRTLQTEDHIFTNQRGDAGMLKMERVKAGSNAGGLVATVAVAVDPEATPRPVGFGPGRPTGA